MPDRGRQIHWNAIDIYRITDGRISEEWAFDDAADIMYQLGALTHRGPGDLDSKHGRPSVGDLWEAAQLQPSSLSGAGIGFEWADLARTNCNRTRRTLMTDHGMPQKPRSILEPIDEQVDHVRGPTAGHLIVEYGDYECPYSRQAFREIELVERAAAGRIRFAFRHFPLTEIHPHALAAAAAAEAAALQVRFWNMHELLFDHQKALEDHHLRQYAAELELDLARFDHDRTGTEVLERIRRDVESAMRSGQVRGTPTLFIDGVVHLGNYEAATLVEALVR